MSEFNANPPQGPQQPFQPPRPQPRLPDPFRQPTKKPMSRGAKIGWGVLAGFAIFGLGAAVGAGGADPATTAASPTAAKTVEVPGAKTTVTAPPVTKTVSTVPAACKEALDAADKAFGTAGQGFSVVADIMGSVSELDVDGIEAGTRKLTALNKKLTPQLEAYKSARDECQS